MLLVAITLRRARAIAASITVPRQDRGAIAQRSTIPIAIVVVIVAAAAVAVVVVVVKPVKMLMNVAIAADSATVRMLMHHVLMVMRMEVLRMMAANTTTTTTIVVDVVVIVVEGVIVAVAAVAVLALVEKLGPYRADRVFVLLRVARAKDLLLLHAVADGLRWLRKREREKGN